MDMRVVVAVVVAVVKVQQYARSYGERGETA
jgi:hypothetical protein